MTSELALDLLRAVDPVATFERAFRTEPHEWQRAFLRTTDNVLLVKGRQVGASTATAALALHVALYVHESLAVFVSPSQRQSQEVLLKVKAAARNLDRSLTEDSAIAVGFGNGSRIISLPGTATSVRGYSASLLVVDEAAYIDEETWVAVQPLVATGGRSIVQSTPAGRRGWFFESWDAPDLPRWTRLRVRTAEVANVSADFLERQRRELGPVAYAMEYDASFQESGAGMFTEDKLRALIRPDVAALRPEGF